MDTVDIVSKESFQCDFLLRHVIIPHNQLFTQGTIFVDVFNVPRAGYFHRRISHDIAPSN